MMKKRKKERPRLTLDSNTVNRKFVVLFSSFSFYSFVVVVLFVLFFLFLSSYKKLIPLNLSFSFPNKQVLLASSSFASRDVRFGLVRSFKNKVDIFLIFSRHDFTTMSTFELLNYMFRAVPHSHTPYYFNDDSEILLFNFVVSIKVK